LRLCWTRCGLGSSSGRVIPSGGSGQYAPGPSIAGPSLAKDCLPRRYCKCPKKSRLVPGSDARDSIFWPFGVAKIADQEYHPAVKGSLNVRRSALVTAMKALCIVQAHYACLED